MTKEETMERIKLMQDQLKAMQAYVDGKDIELWNPTSKRWELEENPAWSLLWKYRIKPEPTYRPFKDADECWEEMQKHQPFGWIIGKSNHIRRIIESTGSMFTCNGNNVFVGSTWESFAYMFKQYNFADGTPLGKLEE